jgi:class 3 adenylate cyclase/tetratricopeptide (TPR) repeat protein
VICGNCQAENRPDRRFCLRCGQPLASRCPTCGASNEPEAAFCGDCGTRLGAAGQAAVAQPAPLAADAGRTSERRLVTVLFADLVGYTTIAEGLDADDARDLLDRYFGTAREIVQRYGGTVEKFIGDAVMAVWGTPTAHEDDAERAVRAALELVTAIPTLRRDAGRAAGLQLRAGLLTGEAAVNLGADGQGMVAGDLVNTASRLQSVAEAGSVLVGEATMRAASGAITFEAVGDQALKGKGAPVPAWRALTVVGLVGGAGRSELVEPPFVGRDAEFSALKERLHATSRDHRARLVSVVGVAGIGKSRLAWELEKYLDGLVETVYWHHGRSPAYGDGLAFWALGEMVRGRAGIAERDDPATTAAKLDATLAEWLPDAEERRWVGPRLRTLLGLEEAPAGSRDEMFAAWRTFFERIADRATAILVFEDLQWADDGLVDFIESLLEWSRTKPLLIVTLARPELTERRPTWGVGQREFTGLYLEPLPGSVMQELVAGMGEGLPAELVARIVDRSEGIPLYAVELFRMLVDRGDVIAGPAGFRVGAAVAEITAPPTLQALIAARLDAVPGGERRLLQDASILGKTFTVDALAAITGEDAAHLEPLLRNLVRRELLSVDADPRSPERGQYGFVGALVREVAYGTLSKRDRRDRHLAAARWFEGLGDDELAGILASHYTDAVAASTPGPEADAVAAQARIALRAAAERSRALASPAQAAAYLRRALEVTTEPPEIARLHEDIGEALLLSGQFTASKAAAAEAIAGYETVGDVPGAGRAALVLAETMLSDGDVAQAIDVLRRPFERLPATGEERLRIALQAKLARGELFAGRPRQALTLIDAALELAAPLDLVEVIADLLVSRAWALAELGRSRETVALQYGVIQLTQEEHLPRVRFRAINNLVTVLAELRPQQTLVLARDAMLEAERLGDRDWADKLAFVAINMAYTGAWDDAERIVAERLRDDLPTNYWVAPVIGRAIIAMARGELDVVDRIRDEVHRRFLASEDRQVGYALATATFWAAYGRDDAGAAVDGARQLVGVALEIGGETVEGAFFLALAGARQDDATILEEASTALDRATASDAAGAVRAFTGAAIAARAGRASEAALLATQSLDGLRSVGHELWATLIELDLIGVLPPDSPLVVAAAERVRAFATERRATLLLERLEARVAAGADRGRAGQPPRAMDRQPAGTPANVLTTS